MSPSQVYTAEKIVNEIGGRWTAVNDFDRKEFYLRCGIIELHPVSNIYIARTECGQVPMARGTTPKQAIKEHVKQLRRHIRELQKAIDGLPDWAKE